MLLNGFEQTLVGENEQIDARLLLCTTQWFIALKTEKAG
jgi:hypothetical protein